MSEKIGFIGTGIMGLPMASNLLKAGFQVQVWNRTRKKAEPLTGSGAVVTENLRELAVWAETVVLMLTGPDAVDEVVFGKGGLLSAEWCFSRLVNMSTVGPEYSRELARKLKERGIDFVEAPVSGSKKPAEDAALVILAGGDQSTVNDLENIFSAVGKKTVYCGVAGQGAAAKLAVNMLLGIMMEGLGEAVNFAQRSGVSRAMILDIIGAGALNCPLFSAKTGMYHEASYPPQFPLKHILKDMRFALETGRALNAATPSAETVFTQYLEGEKMGLGDQDLAAVIRVLEKKQKS